MKMDGNRMNLICLIFGHKWEHKESEKYKHCIRNKCDAQRQVEQHYGQLLTDGKK